MTQASLLYVPKNKVRPLVRSSKPKFKVHAEIANAHIHMDLLAQYTPRDQEIQNN